jgi:hypothetical protein
MSIVQIVRTLYQEDQYRKIKISNKRWEKTTREYLSIGTLMSKKNLEMIQSNKQRYKITLMLKILKK